MEPSAKYLSLKLSKAAWCLPDQLGGFLSNGEFQFIDLLTVGDKFFYPFGRVSMMGEERDS